MASKHNTRCVGCKKKSMTVLMGGLCERKHYACVCFDCIARTENSDTAGKSMDDVLIFPKFTDNLSAVAVTICPTCLGEANQKSHPPSIIELKLEGLWTDHQKDTLKSALLTWCSVNEIGKRQSAVEDHQNKTLLCLWYSHIFDMTAICKKVGKPHISNRSHHAWLFVAPLRPSRISSSEVSCVEIFQSIHLW